MRLRLPLALLAGPLLAASISAQTSDLQALDLVGTVDLEPLNREAIAKEDVERELQNLPPRFAIPLERRLTPQDSGTWENLDPTTLVWRLRIRAPGATSLNLGFDRYRMAPGGRLFLYSADRVHVVRPFTAADNAAHGELWSPVVQTDDLVLELVIPAAELDRLLLRLTWINQGYRGFGANQLALMSGPCNVDVARPEGLPWQLEIPSVGVISTGGSTFCTGFLVNDVRQDLKPYFITANHCGVNSGNAASLVVYWNYENSTGRTPGSPASGGAGDGSLAQFSTGAFFRAASATSDFTLVELDEPVDPAFDVSWAGWDASGANATSAVGIHHPNTDEKRISFENQAPITSSYLGTTSPGDGTHVRVVDWDLGTTEPGSSGSPLFDQAHRVIGQLHGGGAACGNDDSDYYGRFSVSWTGGGTNSTRLSNWLDPDDTGALVLDTLSLGTLRSAAGRIDLDKGRYGSGGSARVEVVDRDLDLDGSAVEMVTVALSSTSEPAGESLLLTETGPATGRFRGTIALAGTDSPGVLLVAASDTLTARYVDADDGAGAFGVEVTDTALVDCTPPVVQSVAFADVTGTSARMTVLTDEPVAVTALYGLACASTTDARSSEGRSTSATIEFHGLQPNTTYLFKLQVEDDAGNTTLDANGGGCHAVTTDDVPRSFTEEFLGDLDLDNVALFFVPSKHQDGYDVCRRSASSFHTDPAGGTPIALADDGSFQVDLTGGKTVKLYGVAYSSFFVNANGNLTFGAADGTCAESLAQHFSRPRVAALFDDLDPAAGGQVSRKQLYDRIAITWLNVPEYRTSTQNSLQIELFFDGRIRVTHRAVAAADGIVGLSRGTGSSPAFVEPNFSGLAECKRGTKIEDF